MKQSVIVNPVDTGSLPRRNEQSHGRGTIVNASTLDVKEAVFPHVPLAWIDRLSRRLAG
jgi:hypothetical protein